MGRLFHFARIAAALLVAMPLQSAADLHSWNESSSQPSPAKTTPAENVLPAVLKVDSTLVMMDVLVTDEDGRILNELKPGNFRILDNGQPQKLVSFSPTTAPITVVMLLEYSSASYNYFATKGATWASRFLGHLEARNWVALTTFDLKPTVKVDFTHGRYEVRDALASLGPPQFSESNLFDAIVETLDKLDRVRGRKSIVLLATGMNSFSSATFDDVLQRLRRTDTTIFVVGLAEQEYIRYNNSSISYAQAKSWLTTFATQTGGIAFFPRFEGELPEIFRGVVGYLRNEYSLSFRLPRECVTGNITDSKLKLLVRTESRSKSQMKEATATRSTYTHVRAMSPPRTLFSKKSRLDGATVLHHRSRREEVMNDLLRKCAAVAVAPMLIVIPCQSEQIAVQPVSAQNSPQLSLHDYLQKPYEELFELAPSLRFSAAEVEEERQALKGGEQSCRDRFKSHSKTYGKQLENARKELKLRSAALEDEPRHGLHCKIQNLELLQSEADVLSGQAIPHVYDNLNAKLDLIQQWPDQYRQTQAVIADGSYQQRRWADVKDIGFREIAAGQKDDIKRGKEAVDELKTLGLMPPEVDNKAIQSYVKSVAERIAQHSDLKVPLHISVLQSKEINAFALPGGYLFVERGLLEETDDEAQLAGVIAHEIAHDTARHGAKLMKRATIAGIFYQAAQIAAMVLTGGVAGIGLYYALQYGFYGLGMVLDLKLLGINREYELEADQLGVQYAWNAGYDTSGFIRFFDKMATRVG